MDPSRRSRRYIDEEYDSYSQRGHYQRGSDYHVRDSRVPSPDRRRYEDYSDRRRFHDSYCERDDYYREARRTPPLEYSDDPAVAPYFEASAEPANTGETDVSLDEQPIQFLLIRGIKSNVTETLIAKGMEKLYREPPTAVPALGAASAVSTTGAAQNSIKRVFLIRDRITEQSAGFAFVEFFYASEAAAALARARELGRRCTIGSKEINVSFPHLGIFVNVPADQVHPKHSFWLREGAAYEYHDRRYFASELVVNEKSHNPPPRPATPSKAESKKATRKRSVANSIDSSGQSMAKKPRTGTVEMVENLNRIRMKNRQVHSITGDGNTDVPPPTSIISSSANENKQSYVYIGILKGKDQTTCLLCASVLASHIDPVRHCKESKAHIKNLADDAKVQAAQDRLKQFNISVDQTVPLPAPPKSKPTVYVDRAAERREEEARERQREEAKRALLDTAVEPVKISLKPAIAPADPMQSTYGKGFKLLQKAGFVAGQDKGVGSGITAPISQGLYAAGVGLGHESSHQGDALDGADQKTRNENKTYGERAKDLARERYQQMTKDDPEP